MRAKFSRESNADLEAIGDFIARDNPRRAESFLDELHEAAESLAQFPHRFPASDFDPAIRRAVHGAYNIYYAVRPDHVRVLRVIHGAQALDESIFRQDS